MTIPPVNVLVACEFSGIVREAFRRKGHRAVSCDYLPSDLPGEHIQANVRDVMFEYPWDMMIAFPPCTYLCRSGARWWRKGMYEQRDAMAFFIELFRAPVPRVAIENPIGIMSTHYRKPDQYIQPWMFGHPETKKTCLWLRNLPLLKPTEIVDGRADRVHNHVGPGPDRWKHRSRTYEGIAKAMAEQWG